MPGATRGLSTYLTSKPNSFFQAGNNWYNRLDDGFFKLGAHSAGLGREISKLHGHTAAAKKFDAVSDGFNTARSCISGTRFIFPLHNLVTGQTIWQTDATLGWRRVQYAHGKPVTIPAHQKLDGTWNKVDGVWTNGVQRSSDGKYIDDVHGDYITNDWMSIAMSVCIIFARIIAPFRMLHNLKAIDLGHHAKGLSGATMGLWGAVLAINLVQAARDLVVEVDAEVIQKRVWDAVQAALDLAALPFDFGLGSQHPALAVTGAVLNILSAGNLLVKDAYYYS